MLKLYDLGALRILIRNICYLSQHPSTEVANVRVLGKEARLYNIKRLTDGIEFILQEVYEPPNAIEYDVVPLEDFGVVASLGAFDAHLNKIAILVLQESSNLILPETEPLLEGGNDVEDGGVRVVHFVP